MWSPMWSRNICRSRRHRLTARCAVHTTSTRLDGSNMPRGPPTGRASSSAHSGQRLVWAGQTGPWRLAPPKKAPTVTPGIWPSATVTGSCWNPFQPPSLSLCWLPNLTQPHPLTRPTSLGTQLLILLRKIRFLVLQYVFWLSSGHFCMVF